MRRFSSTKEENFNVGRAMSTFVTFLYICWHKCPCCYLKEKKTNSNISRPTCIWLSSQFHFLLTLMSKWFELNIDVANNAHHMYIINYKHVLYLIFFIFTKLGVCYWKLFNLRNFDGNFLCFSPGEYKSSEDLKFLFRNTYSIQKLYSC